MIERIYDEQYYSFAPKLKSLINQELHLFFKGISALINSRTELEKDMTLYIRQENYFQKNKKNYFVIDFDSQARLQLYGEYNPSTNSLSNISLKAALPSTLTWNSIELQRWPLSASEGDILKTKHYRFANLITSYNLQDSDGGEAPVDKVWGYSQRSAAIIAPGGPMEEFLNGYEGVRFIDAYYKYIHTIDSFFGRKFR